ncbi:bifunctional metallophosphatase/5'-nucleotidase [bacterium]|nr:bifunctional metallophosphatase/5'-nucleotidase [bacterium]
MNINPVSSPVAPKTTRTSIFYVNDLHRCTPKMEKIYNASKAFDSFIPSYKVDKLKLSSGDTMLGQDEDKNSVAAMFLDLIGVTATALGNHECDSKPEELYKLTKDKKYKILGLNVNIDKKNPLSNRIEKSYIEEKNGTKYGIIGLLPIDLFHILNNKNEYESFKIDDFDKTIKDVQSEIDKFQKQGVDKVIVLSHVGNKLEKRLAKETSGIDVILGGHSHELIKGIEKGKNLLYGKDGNPVIITQAGKDADHFGVLDIEFNDKGVITKARNSVNNTKDYQSNMIMSYLEDRFIGKSEVIGLANIVDDEPENKLVAENPHANFVADAMRYYTNSDIALLGSANLRNKFDNGNITSRLVESIVPFKNDMYVVKYSEKALVDALKHGAKSITEHSTKPGFLQVSGLNYKLNKKGELLSVDFVDKDGNKHPLNIKNPSNDKKFNVAIDGFYAKQGGDKYYMLKTNDSDIVSFYKGKSSFDDKGKFKNEITPAEKTKLVNKATLEVKNKSEEKTTLADKDRMVKEYIKKAFADKGKEVQIKCDKRIQVVD